MSCRVPTPANTRVEPPTLRSLSSPSEAPAPRPRALSPRPGSPSFRGSALGSPGRPLRRPRLGALSLPRPAGPGCGSSSRRGGGGGAGRVRPPRCRLGGSRGPPAPDPGSRPASRVPSPAGWAPHLPGPSVGGGRLPRRAGRGPHRHLLFLKAARRAGRGRRRSLRPGPAGVTALRSASRPPTHLCVFPAEIKVLPESLRAEGCGPPAAAGARAVSSSRGWGQGLSGAGNAGAAPRRVLRQPARPPGSVRPGVGGGGGRLEPSGENKKWGPWKESCGQHAGCPPLSLPSVLGRGWAGSRNPPPSFLSRVCPWG